MRQTPLVLLIHESSADAEFIRRSLLDAGESRVQCVTRLSSALARIAGGGVDGIVLDLTSPSRKESEKLEDFLKLKNEAPDLPILVVCGPDEDALINLTALAGASASVTVAQCQAGLATLLRKLLEARSTEACAATADHGNRGPVIGLLGCKGGVGTTTVAVNVACALAQDRQVILTEMRTWLGTLSAHFGVRERVRDLSSVQQPGPSEIEACLWPYRRIPGLRILFGQQKPYPDREMAPGYARSLAKSLGTMADYAIADLAPILSESSRAFIESCACLAIVIERDRVCLEAAGSMLRAISNWEKAPRSIGAVIVNRSAVAAPVPIAEFEERLDIPIFAVIPPAADDYLAAQKAGRPLVSLEIESLATNALIDLADALRDSVGPSNLGRKRATT